jgi:hypothetical protein
MERAAGRMVRGSLPSDTGSPHPSRVPQGLYPGLVS